jgi:hypothetical protein
MDLLQEMLKMPLDQDTRPAAPAGAAPQHPPVLVFGNLPAGE